MEDTVWVCVSDEEGQQRFVSSFRWSTYLCLIFFSYSFVLCFYLKIMSYFCLVLKSYLMFCRPTFIFLFVLYFLCFSMCAVVMLIRTKRGEKNSLLNLPREQAMRYEVLVTFFLIHAMQGQLASLPSDLPALSFLFHSWVQWGHKWSGDLEKSFEVLTSTCRLTAQHSKH